jgi:hypothetical protein
MPIEYNKDKPDKAHKYRGLRVCPYSFSIYLPRKTRHNEGCQKVRCTVKDKSNMYLSSRERTASRLGAFYQQGTGQRPRVGVCRGNCPDRPVRVSLCARLSCSLPNVSEGWHISVHAVRSARPLSGQAACVASLRTKVRGLGRRWTSGHWRSSPPCAALQYPLMLLRHFFPCQLCEA